MANTQNWREQRAALVNRSRDIMESAEAEGRELLAEEREQIDTMMNQVDALKQDIDRAEAAAEEARDIQAATDRKSEMRLAEKPEAREAKRGGVDSGEYRDAFDAYLRRGVRGMSSDETRALEAGVGSEGGFLAPTVNTDQASMQAQIIETVDEAVALMQLGTVLNVTGDITIPTESTLGAASWTAEEAAYNDSDVVFGQVTLTPHKATTMVQVSEELLADSAVDLQAYLSRNFGRRFANLLGTAFMAGTGSGQPTSLTDQSTYSGTTTASATAVTFDEMISLYYSLKEQYRANGTWIFNSTTAAEVRQLKDGGGQYIWQPSASMGEPDTLLGRPIAIDDNAEDTASAKKAVLFGDMSYYYIAMRQGVTLRRLDELYAANGQVGMLASIRVDGELTLGESVKHLLQKTA